LNNKACDANLPQTYGCSIKTVFAASINKVTIEDWHMRKLSYVITATHNVKGQLKLHPCDHFNKKPLLIIKEKSYKHDTHL